MQQKARDPPPNSDKRGNSSTRRIDGGKQARRGASESVLVCDIKHCPKFLLYDKQQHNVACIQGSSGKQIVFLSKSVWKRHHHSMAASLSQHWEWRKFLLAINWVPLLQSMCQIQHGFIRKIRLWSNLRYTASQETNSAFNKFDIWCTKVDILQGSRLTESPNWITLQWKNTWKKTHITKSWHLRGCGQQVNTCANLSGGIAGHQQAILRVVKKNLQRHYVETKSCWLLPIRRLPLREQRKSLLFGWLWWYQIGCSQNWLSVVVGFYLT